MIKKAPIMLVLVLLLSLFLTACGGGDSGGGGAAEAGAKLYDKDIIGTQPGCKTCHSLEAGKVVIGPSLAGIGTRAGSTIDGMSAEDYLKQSILEPDAFLVDGFPAGTMPKVWSVELTPEQVDQLVAFLLTQK